MISNFEAKIANKECKPLTYSLFNTNKNVIRFFIGVLTGHCWGTNATLEKRTCVYEEELKTIE